MGQSIVYGGLLGAVGGFTSGYMMTGTLQGALTGAKWGAISGAIAGGIGGGFGHGADPFWKTGSLHELGRSLLHGLSRGYIAELQGGNFRAGFWSGFAASAFSPGTTMGGNGIGGFAARTTMAATVGGTASQMGGGKFANGAVSGAFVHMFNAEGGAATTLGVVGKVWNSMNTAIGLVYGGLGYIVGMMKGTNPSWQFGHNAIEFLNNPFGGDGAITFGNTITYGVDIDPKNDIGYDGNSLGIHELQHTIQGEILGPLYIFYHAASWTTGLIMDGDIHGAHAFGEIGPSSHPPRPF